MKRIFAAVLLVFGLGMTPACQTNPATGARNFNLIGEGQEISLGAEAAPQFLKEYGGPIPSTRVQNYVRDIGLRMAAESERPQLPWEFHAVDSKVVNAFALPGGKVFVTRGLLELFENEAQLAGVIGHEIGHVTAQHIGQQMSQAIAIQGLAVGLGVAGAVSDNDWLATVGAGTQVGGTVYLLSFGRSQELQSDELGLRYMTSQGYNPVGLLQVMEVFQRMSGGQRAPEFLSTHPYPESRIDQINRLIRERYPQYDQPGVYRFNQDQYKASVLDEIAKLPAPKHQAMHPQLHQLYDAVAQQWQHDHASCSSGCAMVPGHGHVAADATTMGQHDHD